MIFQNRKLKFYILFISSILLFSCNPEKDSDVITENNNTKVWHLQSEFDLGSKIEMKNSNFGLAISRGRGEEVQGKSYIFSDGKWSPFDSFDYSDFPLITEYKSGLIWYVIHETHYGKYRPRMFEYNIQTKEKKEIPLPKIFWDATDYVMWKDIQVLKDGTAWIVGQQGHIIYYDGKSWSEFESPVKKFDPTKLWAGDLNSIFMIDENNGWAVGRNGIILKFENGIWSVYQAGKDVEYFDVIIIDNEGWIVGSNSEILKFENGEWKNFKSENRINLKSISAVSKNDVWFCGENSTLLHFNGNDLEQISDIKIFDDDFNDLSILYNENGDLQIWVLGSNGVYSISQSFGFSFTKLTSQAGLRLEGNFSIPIELNNDGYTDLLIFLDNATPLLFQNLQNGTFSEIAFSSAGIDNVITAKYGTSGDINNDGNDDLFLFSNDSEFSLLLGNGNFSFKEITDYSNLKINPIELGVYSQVKFIDMNNDGNLDLYISTGNSDDMLFMNDGTGKFSDVYSKTNIKKNDKMGGIGSVFSDFNNDNLVDIFIGYRFSQSGKYFDLYLNKGNFVFENVDDSSFKFDETTTPYSSVSLDYNNDGNMDIFVFANNTGHFIFENDGHANFKILDSEIGFDEKFMHPEPINGIIASEDINNDGFDDLFIGSRLYINKNGIFENITPYIGLNFIGNPTFLDYDNDLDFDLFIGSSRASLGEGDRFGLFRNNLVQNNSVKIVLHSDLSNRSSIGAKISLKDSLENLQKKEIGIGKNPLNGGYTNYQIFRNEQKTNSELEVIFPSGKKNISNISGNEKVIDIYESDSFDRFFILSYKSINRTLKLINPILDSIKLFFFILLLSALIIYSKKTKAIKYTLNWYFPLISLIFFILLFHFTINTEYIFELGITVLIPAIFVFAFVFITDKQIEKKESKFISHYKLLEILGVGGMGKVFKAIDTTDKKFVAIKVINPAVAKDEENKKRLSSEGRLLSSIIHPNIVKVFEVSETEKHTFIAMEFLSGGTLHDLIQEKYPFSLEDFKEIVFQICDGLHFIHSKEIIHRDLKSQNIMFDNEKKLRIMDFGLSKSPLVSTMTSLGTVLGTLGYVAPEQVTGIDIDHRADIFSMGVIMYQMLTKKLPFNGENEIALIHSIFNTIPVKPSEINSLYNNKIDEIVLKLLAKEPNDRYNNIAELKSEITRIN